MRRDPFRTAEIVSMIAFAVTALALAIVIIVGFSRLANQNNMHQACAEAGGIPYESLCLNSDLVIVLDDG